MTPPELPGFTFVQPLGSGGFAEVFLYQQDWPRQKVAVKVVRPDVALTAYEKTMFRQEADAMARLADHPYIVSVLTAGETSDGRPYLVMRYCPPPDLGARVRRRPMSVNDTLATGVKLASAVETAHRSGILHRDIKPSNVLMTTYNEPALTDFGIAGRMHELEVERETRMSFPWAPPELIDGRSNGSVASDVYSLGATIWNLIVGRSPFAIPYGDNSDHALVTRILHGTTPETRVADVPPALEHLLQRCLAKDPAHRPATALEVARSLQRIETDLGHTPTPVAVEDSRDDGDYDTGGGPAATRVKPVGVMHARTTGGSARPRTGGSKTGPGASTGGWGGTTDPGTGRGRSPRGAVWWSLAGVCVAVALLATLLLRGGSGGSHEKPTPSPTPDPVITAELPPPAVGPGRRVGDKIRFTWTQPDQKPGDSWAWQNVHDDTEGERTSRPTADLTATGGPVCISVTLVRGGDTSEPTQRCFR